MAIAAWVVLAVMGFAGSASGTALIFAAVFLATVGSLGILTQFAIIREVRSVVEELGKLGNWGLLATNISRSAGFLTMTQGLMVFFSLAVIAGFVVVVLF